MKTIGLLGGMSWPSTIEYYRFLNQLTQEKLGGYHSANVLLYSIDYH
jgi:aspartate racemase